MSDILLIDNDGGSFEYGAYNDIRLDDTIMSMCYVSLFNGDTPLNALRQEQFDNEFEKAINKRLSFKNRQEAETIGTTRLQWLKTEGIVKDIELTISQESVERYKILISGTLPNGSQFTQILTTIKAV